MSSDIGRISWYALALLLLVAMALGGIIWASVWWTDFPSDEQVFIEDTSRQGANWHRPDADLEEVLQLVIRHWGAGGALLR